MSAGGKGGTGFEKVGKGGELAEKTFPIQRVNLAPESSVFIGHREYPANCAPRILKENKGVYGAFRSVFHVVEGQPPSLGGGTIPIIKSYPAAQMSRQL